MIEVPLTGELDVNGRDLAKALRLMLKGNAVVLEWLRSPIAYRCDPGFRDAFLALARDCADRRLIGRHYLHLGERQRRTYFGDGKSVALKKLFYALRPAAALRWLRMHQEEAVPPMHFPTLMSVKTSGISLSSIISLVVSLTRAAMSSLSFLETDTVASTTTSPVNRASKCLGSLSLAASASFLDSARRRLRVR